MSKRSVNNDTINNYGGHYNKPFDTSKYSIFALRPCSYDPRNEYGITKWELLTDYLERRHITRWYVRKFTSKKWIAVTSVKNRLYVCEFCPDLIDEYLGVESKSD
jgi:hypothetical protein